VTEILPARFRTDLEAAMVALVLTADPDKTEALREMTK
jgi:DNA-binding transcriptional regulator/RsmH inhibitor MraZ